MTQLRILQLVLALALPVILSACSSPQVHMRVPARLAGSFQTPGGFSGTIALHLTDHVTTLPRFIGPEDLRVLRADLASREERPPVVVGYADVTWRPAAPLQMNKLGGGPFTERLLLLAIDGGNGGAQLFGLQSYDIGRNPVGGGSYNYTPIVSFSGFAGPATRNAIDLIVHEFSPVDGKPGAWHRVEVRLAEGR